VLGVAGKLVKDVFTYGGGILKKKNKKNISLLETKRPLLGFKEF
jgi:hypothetical protein